MTSVLNGGGLNYQIGNPVRYEFTKINTLVSDLKKVVDGQGVVINGVKTATSEVVELKSQVSDLKNKVTGLEKMCHDMMATIVSMRS
jgi:hypothetical protein